MLLRIEFGNRLSQQSSCWIQQFKQWLLLLLPLLPLLTLFALLAFLLGHKFLLISLICFHLPAVITCKTDGFSCPCYAGSNSLNTHSQLVLMSVLTHANEQGAGLAVSSGNTQFRPGGFRRGGFGTPVANTIQCHLIRGWSRLFLRFKMTDLEAK